MVIPITTLWLPILVSGVLVFVVSSVVHMLLPYHKNDFAKVADEDRAQDALRGANIPAGDYLVPHPGDAEYMRSEAFKQKVQKGPTVALTVFPPNAMGNMGSQLAQWFAYTLLVGVVVAYLAGRVVAPGTDYLQVFRVTGTVAFACYSMALMQRSIWYFTSWRSTLTSMFDGLLYALVTGGAFGWLWP